MPVMYILRGIPASGKSTFRDSKRLPYVNRDELREQYPYAKEKDISKIQDDTVRNYMQGRINFIIDNTHVRERAYNRYVQEATNAGYEVEIVEFKTPLYECIENNRNRIRQVPLSVILKMAHDIGWYEDELRFYFCGNKDKQRAIIVDLDGTLCNISHRRHHVLTKPKNWKAFFAGISEDTVEYAVEHIIRTYYYAGKRILLVSGRPENYRDVTEDWLRKHNIPYTWLLMRPFNSKEDDVEVKRYILNTYIKPYFDVLFAIDDRKRVCRMWYEEKIPLFMVGDPDAEEF